MIRNVWLNSEESASSFNISQDTDISIISAEIGPKHGRDSKLLAGLNPAELVLIDLPEKDPTIQGWLGEIDCKMRHIQDNILYMSSAQREELGTFDLIWCLGVIYHNIEQLRLLKRLYDLCAVGGRIVVESSTTRNKKLVDLNVVEIHWPETYRNVPTVTHHPSRLAVRSWLEMVGFLDVEICGVYSRYLRWQRAVLTGLRTRESRPFTYYVDAANPEYVAGDAT